MSLSGNLGFVALHEVLRLLSRSHQQGAVDIRGDGLHGRIYVGKKGIDLATTYDNDEIRRHLMQSGLVDEARLAAMEAGDSGLAGSDDDVNALVELIREMTVESIHQLSDRGSHFEVYEQSTTPYASPRPFELEEILSAARRRSEDWKAVRRTIPDLDAMVDFKRDLGDRAEIKVGADAWKVISEIRAGSSVSEMADRLGTTDFWAARVVADLVSKDLLTLASGAVYAEPEAEAEEEATEEYVSPYDTPERLPEEEASEDAYEAYEEDYEEHEEGDEGQHEEMAEERDEEVADEMAGAPSHNQSWWQDPESKETPRADGEVEEDTEAFLEKVFSELEETDQQDEGHGLLRRRRLGALRDLGGDS